jgi:hypothetical protein
VRQGLDRRALSSRGLIWVRRERSIPRAIGDFVGLAWEQQSAHIQTRNRGGHFLYGRMGLRIADAREIDVPFRPIVPNSWTLLPRAPDTLGRRFISPSGDAWLWYFAVPVRAQGGPPIARGQATYEARGSDWIVSSGYRGDRIFYRRAMLACNNTKWRQIEFEYPASEKRLFDSFVTRTSYALRVYKELGC